jgi:hypothetical protein
MPVGKSGKYYMNPHEMRRKESSSDDKMGGGNMDDKKMPPKDEGHDPVGQGDGNHHHEIHMHEDGSAHSKHTHPDGHEDHQEHGSYDEAKGHMDQAMGQGEEGTDPNASAPMDDGDEDDMAGMYAEGGE